MSLKKIALGNLPFLNCTLKYEQSTRTLHFFKKKFFFNDFSLVTIILE